MHKRSPPRRIVIGLAILLLSLHHCHVQGRDRSVFQFSLHNYRPPYVASTSQNIGLIATGTLLALRICHHAMPDPAGSNWPATLRTPAGSHLLSAGSEHENRQSGV